MSGDLVEATAKRQVRKNGLTHQVMSGVIWLAWGRAARAVLQVVVLAVLARLLSPADFGVVSAALVVIGFSTIFTQMGLGPALVQRPVLETRHLRTAFSSSLILAIVIAALLALGAPGIATFLRIPDVAPVLRALVWIFPLKAFSVVSESMLTRELRFRAIANREVVSYALGYGVVGVATALSGWGVWSLVAAQLAQSTVNTVLLMVVWRTPAAFLPDRQSFNDLLHFSSGFTIARFANQLAHQGDNLVVGRWLGAAALGFYGRAYQLMAMPADLFGGILDNVLFPAMAKVQTESQRLEVMYRRGISLVALVMLPVGSVLFVLAPELVEVVLGPHWAGVVPPFRVFCVGLLFRTSYRLSDSVARATGAVYRRAWRQIVYALLVLFGAWGGQRWGVEGAAVGVLVAQVLNFIMMAELSVRVTEMTWWRILRAHLPALWLAAGSGVLTLAVSTSLRATTLSALPRLAVAGFSVSVVVVALVCTMPRLLLGADGLWMLQLLRSYLPRQISPRVATGTAS